MSLLSALSARRVTSIVAAAVVATLSACGSTAQLSGAGSPLDSASTTGGGLAAGDTGSFVGSPGGGDASSGGGVATGDAVSGSGSTSTTGALTGGTSASGVAPTRDTARVTGRGFTAKEIRIGYTYSEDGAAVAGGLGVDTAYLNAGDISVQARAIAHYINTHGGVLGRKFVPVAQTVSTQESLRDPDGSAEKLCTGWTQDHKVFVGVNAMGLNNPVLRTCMAKADTPLLEATGRTLGQPVYEKYPSHLYEPGTLTTDLKMKLLVSSLVSRQFFTGWDTTAGRPGKAPVKIGLMVVDREDNRYEASRLKLELARHGLRVAEEYIYPPTLDGLASGSSSAQLRFAANGVTHVFGAYIYFMNNANSQRYYPRYAIDPTGAAAAASTAEAAGSKDQLRGAMTASWLPAVDVYGADYPGDPSPATKICKKIMRDAQQDYSADGGVLQNMLGFCDVMFLVADALNRSGEISTAGLRAGVDSLGSSWHSAQTWTNVFGPRQHASAVAVRDQSYFESCVCFRYTSAQNRTS